MLTGTNDLGIFIASFYLFVLVSDHCTCTSNQCASIQKGNTDLDAGCLEAKGPLPIKIHDELLWKLLAIMCNFPLASGLICLPSFFY